MKTLACSVVLFSTLVVIVVGAPAAGNERKLTGGNQASKGDNEKIVIDPVAVAMAQQSGSEKQAEHNHDHDHDHEDKMDANLDDEDKEAATIEGEEALRTKRQSYDHSHCYHDHCHDYYSDGHSHVRWGGYGRRRWGGWNNNRNWGCGR